MISSLILLCNKLSEELKQTVGKINKSNDEVSKYWRDNKRNDFKEIVDSCKSILGKADGDINRCKEYLHNILAIINEYEGIGFNSHREATTSYVINQGNNYNSSYQDRYRQTPISEGNWLGDRGESIFVSTNNEANRYLNDVGQVGVQYTNCIPDFGIVSKGTVEINGMSVRRYLNFRLADEQLSQRRGCTPRDVAEWRENNHYTWHECNDMRTCMKIPIVINSTFGHLGGVSECSRMNGDVFDE
ncbi:MAG: HNH endonuclease [Clostridia bacterium]|nr:HNH endonuclease [Clostridia bacterium]